MGLVYFWFLVFSYSFAASAALNCTIAYHFDGNYVRAGEKECSSGKCEIHFNNFEGNIFYLHYCRFTEIPSLTPNAGEQNPACVPEQIQYTNATMGTWNRIVCQCDSNLCNSARSPMHHEMAKNIRKLIGNSIANEIMPTTTTTLKPSIEVLKGQKSSSAEEATTTWILFFVLVTIVFL